MKSREYYGRSAFQLCPVCRTQRCIEDVRRAEVIIKEHGGGRQWSKHAHTELAGPAKAAELDLIKFWVGQFGEKEMHRHVHENGIWLSYPKARTNLLRLKLQCCGDLEWDTEEDRLSDALKRLLDHFAKPALELLQAYQEDGTIGLLEYISAIENRKRERQMELANTLGYPKPQEYYSYGKVFRLTKRQEHFIAAAGDEDPAYQPPYKRRKRCTENFDQVEFDTYVYTRTERDVDRRFLDPKDDSDLSLEKVHRDPSLIPPPGGILYSIENFAPVQESLPQPIQGRTKSPPERAYTWSKTEFKKERRLKGPQRWKLRPPRPSPGYEAVSTSGYKTAQNRKQKLIVEEWKAYVKKQLAEGRKVRRQREIQAWALSAELRPHGGMASAFSFGEWVGGEALHIARRYFWS